MTIQVLVIVFAVWAFVVPLAAIGVGMRIGFLRRGRARARRRTSPDFLAPLRRPLQ